MNSNENAIKFNEIDATNAEQQQRASKHRQLGHHRKDQRERERARARKKKKQADSQCNAQDTQEHNA